MKRMIVRCVAALAVTAVTAGCYTYRAVSPTEVSPQDRIRVTVSVERSVELADVFRGYPTRTFNAVYLDGEEEMLFSVPFRNPTPGTSSATLHNRISVPRVDVVSLEARELSRWRTAAVVGGVGVAVGTVAAIAFSGGGDPNDGKRGEVDAFIPLFSWAWQ